MEIYIYTLRRYVIHAELWIIRKNNMKQLKAKLLTLSVLSCLMLTACNDSNDHDDVQVITPPATIPTPTTDCMWREAATSRSHTGADPENFAYPDTNVNYWASQFTIPEGAKVYLDGDYPYARHSSLVSYTAAGERVNSLRDVEIVPNQGVTNPFIIGNNRLDKARGYQAEIKLGNQPTTPEQNTLYAPKTETNDVAVLYRIYVPNKGYNLQAGVSLPRFKVVLANGEEKRGNDVCQVLKVKNQGISKAAITSKELFTSLVGTQNSLGFPAQTIPKWYTAYNGPANVACIYKLKGLTQCEGFQTERKLNHWATPDNEYVFATLSRDLGKVAILRAKAPTTTKTLNNDAIVSNADMRYWSICTNELASTATNYCLYDEEVTKRDADGYYNIVVSLPEDRPNNATESCGYHYLESSPRGAGYPELGAKNNHLNFLLMRHLLPSPSFKNSIQNTKIWGDEEQVMGEYLPKITYTSKTDFEAKGCN